MRLLYGLFIRIYTLGIALFAAINDKASLWIKGRKNWQTKLKSINFKEGKVFWFHCASLGEFEQGRPLIEELKARGHYRILLTFFSPSGYELRKNYELADWVMYLPADTLNNANFFVETVQPKAVFFIKYEFWFNYLYVLKKKEVPVFLIAGIFRTKQYFFKWYGSWAAKQLKAFSYFFVQNNQSEVLLKSLGYNNVFTAGDTRFDRVIQIMAQRKTFEPLNLFAQQAFMLVAGSTYTEDEKLLKYCFDKCEEVAIPLKYIIAPHVVSPGRIKEIENLFGAGICIRFSELAHYQSHHKILIIDNIGMLSSLYGYAQLAYIGGGFGKGIHNTLEAAVYGIPLFMGNNYQKFDEAKALVEVGAAIVVNTEDELWASMQKLCLQETVRVNLGALSSAYVYNQQGALSKIMKELTERKIIT